MAITIGSTTFSTLTAQPFGYEETDAKAGLTAQQWTVSGLLTPSEWLSLINSYNGWRNTRITDQDTTVSLVVGTTINFSGTGAGGAVWSNIPCWFSATPVGEQAGKYLSVSFSVVNAAEALQVIQKQKENEVATAIEDTQPDLGTYTINGVVLTLKSPIDGYAGGPTVNLTALGYNYISGPKVVQHQRNVEGYFDTATYPNGVSSINSWYEGQVVSTPASSAYYPTSPPAWSAERVIVSGVTCTRYTVSITLQQVI